MAGPKTIDELNNVICEPTPAVLEAVKSCQGRFAVLGAGGKMGFHLCLMLQRALRALGREGELTAVSRFGSAEGRKPFESAGIPMLAADLSDPAQVEALPEFENVFFLAGVKFGTNDQPELLRRMNIDMPRFVAERFRDSRIVALSSGCVYSFTTPESGGSTEESETDPPGEYAKSCLGRENAFREAGEKFGTKSALIRLNYSIDLRYGVLVDIAQKVYAGEPVPVEMGHVNVIWQGDALTTIVQALPHASAPPFVLNVTGEKILRVRDIVEAFAERLGRTAEFRGTEQPTAWLNNASKSQRMFGPPRISPEQMYDWIADWLRQGGETLRKPTHFEVRDGDY